MKFALVTPTYRPDFDRTRLLVESVARFAPESMDHYLVVDRREINLFKPLTGSRTKLILVEDLIPWWIMRVPGAKRWWLSLKTQPIRNWVLQQLVKLSVAGWVEADALMFVDSDVCFIRPFSLDRFQQGGRLRLSRVEFQSEQHARWLDTASRLLGARDKPIPPVNYIGNLISWRSDVVIKLRDHISRVSGTSWQRAFAREWAVAEYMLYGLYVENVLGIEAAGHFADTRPVLHLSWGHSFNDTSGVDAFFNGLLDDHIGVMIHSKLNVPVEAYRPHVESLWRNAETGVGAGR